MYVPSGQGRVPRPDHTYSDTKASGAREATRGRPRRGRPRVWETGSMIRGLDLPSDGYITITIILPELVALTYLPALSEPSSSSKA
jgi:hypothetical protein